MNLLKSKNNNSTKQNDYKPFKYDALVMIFPLIGLFILTSLAITIVKSCSNENKTQQNSEITVSKSDVICEIHNLNAVSKDEENFLVNENDLNYNFLGTSGILKVITPNGYIITNKFSINCKN